MPLNIEAADDLRWGDEAVVIVMGVGLTGLANGGVEGRGNWSLLLGELQDC